MSSEQNSFPIFQITDLKVRYGRTQAVDGLCLNLAKAEALGLLGANGAGKTSTLRSLMGMHRPQSGSVAVFGGKPGSTAILKRIGFAPEEALPPERFSGQEYLSFIASLRQSDVSKRKDEIAQLLEEFDLVPHKRVRDYSKGMKRRLVLAQAFLGTPELLVLDEPLNGLDPLIIVKLRARLEKYRAEGGSLLYSSHILAEVEKTCTRIAIMRSGKLVLETPVAEAAAKYGSVEAAFEAVAGRE
jgi:ABC-2 type transport system ATP-binding protein